MTTVKKRFIKANYDRIEDPATTYIPPQEKSEEEKVKSPEFEYAIELACPKEAVKALQLNQIFALGRTATEPTIQQFKIVPQEKSVLLIASVMENEPRPLHVMSGDASLNTSLETVTLEAIDTHIAHDGFVPVQLGIEISERLGLPTSGYYYHFMDEALLHEYKIVDGDTTWGFQVTESTSSGLSDVLLSENVVSSCILLPWRVADAPVGPQHLFHSEFKLTQKEFDAIDGAWLAKNATLLDLDAIIAVGEQQFFEAASHCGEGHIHTVIKHDTLSEIAYDRGYRLDDVLDLNPDYKVGDRRHTIYPGERIILATPELADDPSRSLEKAEYYKVAQASTLNEVASQAGIPLATLLELNPFLNSLTPEEKVMAGDVVIVKTTEETVTGPREHTVKETQDPLGHESLGTIASTYNVPAAQIAKINGLNTSDPFFSLAVGQVLIIDTPKTEAEKVKRNTFPAVLVEDVNLADNMIYHYDNALLSDCLAAISSKRQLAPGGAVIRVASLAPTAEVQTIKLCLSRYALDETEQSQVLGEEKVQLLGKHPIDAALSEKYALPEHPLALQTAHSLTIRQLRHGHVYVYYAAANQNVAQRYAHAGKLHEYRYEKGLFEREGEQTPYLPCYSLNGRAYIAFSEHEWTDRQKALFIGDPEHRNALIRNTGAVYDFKHRSEQPLGEETVFNDVANLVADMDAGSANQDRRFANTTVPTDAADAEKDAAGKEEYFIPVQSNQPLLDSMDAEDPHYADIVILEDKIALVEDSLKLTVIASDERNNWQENHLQELNLAKAVAEFCNLQLLPEDTLAQEVKNDELKKSQLALAINKELQHLSATLSMGESQVAWLEQEFAKQGNPVNLSFFSKVESNVKELGLRTSDPLRAYQKEYIRQVLDKSKWRSRVDLAEVNNVIVEHTMKKLDHDKNTEFYAGITLAMLNVIGPTPEWVNFDLQDQAQTEELTLFATGCQSLLASTLSDEQQLAHKAQFSPGQPLINLIGSLFYLGSQELKEKLENFIPLFTDHAPNDAYNQLVAMGFNQEQAQTLIDNAHTWHFQGSEADKSALTAGVASLWGLFTEESFSGWGWFNENFLERYANLKGSFAKLSSDVLSNYILYSINDLMNQALIVQLRVAHKVIKQAPKMKWGLNWISSMMANSVSNGSFSLTKPKKKQLEKIIKEEKKATELLTKMELGISNVTESQKNNQMRDVAEITNRKYDFFEFENPISRKVIKDYAIAPYTKKGLDAIEKYGTRGLDGIVIGLNALALIEDVALITAKHQHYDKDDYTLTYRVLWLLESMTETPRARYQSEMKGLLGKLDQTDKKFTEKALRRLSSKNLFRISRSSGELLPDQSSKKLLRKTLTVGVAGGAAKSLAGAFEAYQIYEYDIPGTSGAVNWAHWGKLASTAFFSMAGALEIAMLSGVAVAPWLIPGLNLLAGVLYAICTAYLNFVKEDDVTSWLITTPWVTSTFVDSNPTPLDYESDGYLKALEAYSRLKNKPTLYYQPTLGEKFYTKPMPYNVAVNDNLHSVNGYWLMVDFPIELREHAARIDAVYYYHGKSEERRVIEQPAQRHLTWAINQSPLVGKGNSTVARLPEKPTNSTSHTETWGNTGTANQLLTFWLPRQYNHNSLMLLVWYPDDLDDNGNPKANSHPHCFDAQRLPISGSVAGLTSQGLEAKPTVVETAFGDTWQDIKGSEVYNAILNTIKQNPTLGSALTVGYQQ